MPQPDQPTGAAKLARLTASALALGAAALLVGCGGGGDHTDVASASPAAPLKASSEPAAAPVTAAAVQSDAELCD